MLDELMVSVQNQDRVRITLMSNGLDHEIWLPFMLPDQLTVHRIMVEAERVLQSNQEWMIGCTNNGKFHTRTSSNRTRKIETLV